MKSIISSLSRELRAVWMLLFVCVILFIATPLFLTGANLLNVLLAASVTALLAAGQTYVIILAEIDLSVGAILGISSIVTAFTLQDHSLWVGLLAGWAVGAAAGLVNGILVTTLRMPSFIATLAMMSVLSGLTLQFSQGNPVSIRSDAFLNIGQSRLLGVPAPVWIMLVAFVVFGFLLARSRFGRYVYAVGDNADAARLAGIKVHRVKILAFVISGLLSATAGFILAARLGTAQPTAGTGLELAAIAAVIIGGTSLAGGRGALAGTLIGALLLGVIDNGLNLLDVSPFLQGVVKGLVILLAIFLDRNSDRVRALVRLVRPSRGTSSGTPHTPADSLTPTGGKS